MRNKKEVKIRGKFLLIGISLVLLFGFIFIVSALTDNEKQALQNELNTFAFSLSDAGYGWLVSHSLNQLNLNTKISIELY